jgi:hypothetical protein
MKPEDRVNAYLAINKSKLEHSTIDLIVSDVKAFVFYGMSPLSDDEIKKLVVRWASFNAVGLLLKPSPLVTGPAAPGAAKGTSGSELIDAVKKAISLINNGVTLVGDEKGNIVLGVSGLTANLKKGDRGVSMGISWGNALVLKADAGIFHFSGSLSKDQWEMSLTFPKDSAVPNLSTLGKVFTEGEKAVRNIAAATASFQNINDATRVGALIKPHVAAVQGAVEAASGIADAGKRGGMSFGLKFGSPDPGPGDSGKMPSGIQGQATITWWF